MQEDRIDTRYEHILYETAVLYDRLLQWRGWGWILTFSSKSDECTLLILTRPRMDSGPLTSLWRRYFTHASIQIFFRGWGWGSSPRYNLKVFRGGAGSEANLSINILTCKLNKFEFSRRRGRESGIWLYLIPIIMRVILKSFRMLTVLNALKLCNRR